MLHSGPILTLFGACSAGSELVVMLQHVQCKPPLSECGRAHSAESSLKQLKLLSITRSVYKAEQAGPSSGLDVFWVFI